MRGARPHFLAAAIERGAQVIVTFNVKDVPDAVLGVHDIEARHPDDFILETMDLAEGKVLAAVAEMAAVAAIRRVPARRTQLDRDRDQTHHGRTHHDSTRPEARRFRRGVCEISREPHETSCRPGTPP